VPAHQNSDAGGCGLGVLPKQLRRCAAPPCLQRRHRAEVGKTKPVVPVVQGACVELSDLDAAQNTLQKGLAAHVNQVLYVVVVAHVYDLCGDALRTAKGICQGTVVRRWNHSDSKKVRATPDWRMMESSVPILISACIGTGTVTVPLSVFFCITR